MKYRVLPGTEEFPRATPEHPIVAEGRQLLAGQIFDEKDFQPGTIESMLYTKYIEVCFDGSEDKPAPPATKPAASKHQ